MPDQGNAGSWWRPYVGKYELTLSDDVSMDDTTIMLSSIQDVIFTSDMVVANQGTSSLAVLPSGCIPDRALYISVVAETEEVLSTVILMIDSTGAISAPLGVPASTTLHLYGVSVNICGNYYREEV